MEKKELQTGMYVKLRDGSICIVQYQNDLLVDVKNGEYATLRNYNDDLTAIGNRCNLDVVVVYEDYKMKNVLWERPKELLTEEEKEYLKAVIKPCKDKVESVQRLIDHLAIHLVVLDGIVLPYFINFGFQFRGLENDKEYTLKELGLED